MTLTDAEAVKELRCMAIVRDFDDPERAACQRGADAIEAQARLRAALEEMVRVARVVDDWCDVEGCGCSYETALVQARAALTDVAPAPPLPRPSPPAPAVPPASDALPVYCTGPGCPACAAYDEAADALRAPAPVAGSGWRDIGEAPREEDAAILVWHDDVWLVAHYATWEFTPEQMHRVWRGTPEAFAGWIDDNGDVLDPQPTRFWPLPAPPAADREKGDGR